MKKRTFLSTLLLATPVVTYSKLNIGGVKPSPIFSHKKFFDYGLWVDLINSTKSMANITSCLPRVDYTDQNDVVSMLSRDLKDSVVFAPYVETKMTTDFIVDGMEMCNRRISSGDNKFDRALPVIEREIHKRIIFNLLNAGRYTIVSQFDPDIKTTFAIEPNRIGECRVSIDGIGIKFYIKNFIHRIKYMHPNDFSGDFLSMTYGMRVPENIKGQMYIKKI
jgi:hypothetical protein